MLIGSPFFVFFCRAIISFSYLAYFGILSIRSKSDRLTLWDLNKLRKIINSTLSLFYFPSNHVKNGTLVILRFEMIELDTSSAISSMDSWCLSSSFMGLLTSSKISPSSQMGLLGGFNSLLDCKVIAFTFSFPSLRGLFSLLLGRLWPFYF